MSPAISVMRELAALGRARTPARDPSWIALRHLVAGAAGPDHADWSTIASAAKHGEVVTLAARAHPELSKRLDTWVQRQTLLDMHLEWALERIAKAFAAADVDRVALLKGSATAYSLYDAPTDRVRRDVDVLVATSQVEDAVAALEGDGWRADVPDALRPGGPLAARAWPMVLELPFGLLSCDLHRRLAYGRRFDIDEPGILDRAVRGVVALPVCSHEDTLVHTCLHIAVNGFQEPLKAWIDLLRLEAREDLDLGAVGDRARAWRCRAAVWACLDVAERWFDVRPPSGVMARIAPPRWQQQALRWLLSGDGPDPLRGAVSRHAAVGASALLICDTPSARARYLSELVMHRLSPASHT